MTPGRTAAAEARHFREVEGHEVLSPWSIKEADPRRRVCNSSRVVRNRRREEARELDHFRLAATDAKNLKKLLSAPVDDGNPLGSSPRQSAIT